MRLHPWGTPEQVNEKIVEIHRITGHNGYMGVFSFSGMPYDEAERNMRPFAREVMPELMKLEIESPQLALSASGFHSCHGAGR